MTLSQPTNLPAQRNGSPQKGGQPNRQRPALKCGTLDLPSFAANHSRKTPRKRQLDSGRLDSAVVVFLLLFGNHPLLWALLLGGALLLPQVLMMRDAVQILQYQRSVAPVLRND
jgi:hypothetical protein